MGELRERTQDRRSTKILKQVVFNHQQIPERVQWESQK